MKKSSIIIEQRLYFQFYLKIGRTLTVKPVENHWIFVSGILM